MINGRWLPVYILIPSSRKVTVEARELQSCLSDVSNLWSTGAHRSYSSNMNHLESHNILSDAQHGFRKKRSCVSQLVLAVLDLAKGIDARDQLDMTLLGFSKAFDKVPHGRLAVTQAPILWNLGTHTCLVFWLPELQDPAGVTGRTHLQHQPSNIWHPARQRYRPDAVSPLPQWSATVPLPKPNSQALCWRWHAIQQHQDIGRRLTFPRGSWLTATLGAWLADGMHPT